MSAAFLRPQANYVRYDKLQYSIFKKAKKKQSLLFVSFEENKLDMNVVQVEIVDHNALTILLGMEKAQIIRLVHKKKKSEIKPILEKGIFSTERALELAGMVDKSREEWKARTIW